MDKHRKNGDSDEQAMVAVLSSDDARDWYLSAQDVANMKAKDVDRHTWKRAKRDVESVWLAVRGWTLLFMLSGFRHDHPKQSSLTCCSCIHAVSRKQ